MKLFYELKLIFFYRFIIFVYYRFILNYWCVIKIDILCNRVLNLTKKKIFFSVFFTKTLKSHYVIEDNEINFLR